MEKFIVPIGMLIAGLVWYAAGESIIFNMWIIGGILYNKLDTL